MKISLLCPLCKLSLQPDAFFGIGLTKSGGEEMCRSCIFFDAILQNPRGNCAGNGYYHQIHGIRNIQKTRIILHPKRLNTLQLIGIDLDRIEFSLKSALTAKPHKISQSFISNDRYTLRIKGSFKFCKIHFHFAHQPFYVTLIYNLQGVTLAPASSASSTKAIVLEKEGEPL